MEEELISSALLSQGKSAISRWLKIKKDFTEGMMVERSEKIKNDVDRFDEGVSVSMIQCFTELKNIDCSVINFEELPTKETVKLFYCYCALSMCLKTLLRPSSMVRMKVDEVQKGKKRLNSKGDILFVVRVAKAKAKNTNTGYVVLTDVVHSMLLSFIASWRMLLSKGIKCLLITWFVVNYFLQEKMKMKCFCVLQELVCL